MFSYLGISYQTAVSVARLIWVCYHDGEMIWWLFNKKKVGLVLGGGVARGIAHVGVLKVLEENKIPVDFIAATSSGALVGAAYAAGLEIRVIEEIAARISWSRILKVAFFRPGFVTGEGLEDFIVKYVGDIKFSELKIPFSVIATDLRTGDAVVLNEGRVAKAVAASSAVSGLFAPEEIGHHQLVDGGLSDNLPVDIAKQMGADYVIASDVVPSKPIHTMPKDSIQVLGRSLDIFTHKLSIENRKKADILIEPQIDEDVWHLDLHKAKHLISAGEVAAHKVINRIKRDLGLRS